jgi:thiaminase
MALTTKTGIRIRCIDLKTEWIQIGGDSILEAASLLKSIREWLAPLNEKILTHPYVTGVENSKLNLDQIKAFVFNQYYIVSYDIKSLGLMLSRSLTRQDTEFFKNVLNGDIEGLDLLIKLGNSLDLSAEQLEQYSVIPEAVAYTHYMATLASFALPGEQAMALIVNLPVWGANCGKLSKALRTNYGIRETGFFDIFTSPMEGAEREAIEVMERYLSEGARHMKRAAMLIQAYELMFWNGIHAVSVST